jgi:outer membrane protein TolC
MENREDTMQGKDWRAFARSLLTGVLIATTGCNAPGTGRQLAQPPSPREEFVPAAVRRHSSPDTVARSSKLEAEISSLKDELSHFKAHVATLREEMDRRSGGEVLAERQSNRGAEGKRGRGEEGTGGGGDKSPSPNMERVVGRPKPAAPRGYPIGGNPAPSEIDRSGIRRVDFLSPPRPETDDDASPPAESRVKPAEPARLVQAGSADRRRPSSEEDRLIVPITLSTALAVTAGQNPQVNFARQQIAEAFAQLEAAEVLWVPSIRAGFNYHKHEGRIQDVAGEVIDTSRGAIYSGLGAMAVGAGSPAVPGLMMNFHISDAIFAPRIAEQSLGARQQASRAVTNDSLLETALAYVDLLEAAQTRTVAEETLENAHRLVEITTAFAETGQGLRADADRAETELAIREVDVRRADEAVRVASVRLSRLLRYDQNQTLMPAEPALIPIELVDVERSLPHLISAGLTSRPELAEARHLVWEAVQRYQRERFAPLMPSVMLGMSAGGNGGGFGSEIDNFGGRFDFDIAAWWELRNLGLGDRAAREAANSRIEQAKWEQLRMMDQVAADVAEAQAEVVVRRDQIADAERGITAAEDSYRRNSERIRDGQGLPIETLQSIQALDQARREYVRVVADYNRSQFRLQRALGWPVDSPDTAPMPDQ